MPTNPCSIADPAGSTSKPKPPTQRRAQIRRGLWLGLLILVVAVATMGRVCLHDFSGWDDRYTIAKNPRMNPPTWQTVRYYWSHSQFGLWIPGTYMAWAGLAKISRLSQPDERGVWLNPWVFHAASVMLHALAAVILFELLKRLLKAETLGDQAAASNPNGRGSREPLAAATIGALLFAIHPVQVEAVAWASGLKDVLCGLLSIVALWQYVCAVQTQFPRYRLLHYLVATVAVACAMLCKPTAMVVPAMALVIDWLILRRSFRRAMVWTIPWWLMGVGVAVVAKLVQPGTGITSTPWYFKPLIASDALAFYFWKLLWPARLAIDYGRTPGVALDHAWAYWTWLAPVALAALLVWKRNAYLTAAAAVFVIGLAPVLGFTRFLFQYYSTVADHYLYLPMIGVAMAAAYVIRRFQTRWLLAMATAVMVLLAWRSIVQAGIWSSDQSLFRHALEVNPDSFLAYNNLSMQLRRGADTSLPASRRKKLERAAALLRQAVAARLRVTGGIDDDPDLHRNLGDVYLDLDEPGRALIEHARALRLELKRPREIQTYVFELTRSLGHDNHLLGKYDEALKYLNLAKKMRPEDPMVRRERTAVLAAMGKK